MKFRQSRMKTFLPALTLAKYCRDNALKTVFEGATEIYEEMKK